MYKNDAPVLLIGIFIRPFKGINHDFSILFFVSKGLNELKSKENVTLLVQYKNNVFNMIFLFFRNLLFFIKPIVWYHCNIKWNKNFGSYNRHSDLEYSVLSYLQTFRVSVIKW